jgi:transcriptional regulator with XRE-family HTH domain
MNPKQNNLKALRLKCHLRQLDVARLLGVKSEDRISHWERGTAMPNVPNLFKLCDLYKVDPYEIYPL